MKTNKPYLLFLSLLAASVLLVAFVWYQKQQATEQDNRPVKGETVTLVDLDNDYRQYVREILQTYQNLNDTLSNRAAQSALAKETGDKLLTLKVPKDLQEVHLELVIALNLIERGHNGEPTQLNKGQSTLQTLINAHDWLKP